MPLARAKSGNVMLLNLFLTYSYLYYLIRNPIFDQYTKPWLLRFSQILSHIPLIGFLISPLMEAVIALQKHYFYTSAS